MGGEELPASLVSPCSGAEEGGAPAPKRRRAVAGALLSVLVQMELSLGAGQEGPAGALAGDAAVAAPPGAGALHPMEGPGGVACVGEGGAAAAVVGGYGAPRQQQEGVDGADTPRATAATRSSALPSDSLAASGPGGGGGDAGACWAAAPSHPLAARPPQPPGRGSAAAAARTAAPCSLARSGSAPHPAAAPRAKGAALSAQPLQASAATSSCTSQPFGPARAPPGEGGLPRTHGSCGDLAASLDVTLVRRLVA